MRNADQATDWKAIVQDPLLQDMGEALSRVGSARFVIVYPTRTGWGQTPIGSGSTDIPGFCKTIRSVPEGAAHCRLCHVLMTVAAASGAAHLQRCHAGASVVVSPILEDSKETLAVVSSCQFSEENEWEHVKECAEKLGLDKKKVKKAFQELPPLTKERQTILEAGMRALGRAIELVREIHWLRMQQASQPCEDAPSAALAAALEAANDSSASLQQPVSTEMPLLVRVVCQIIDQRPELPLNVQQLAGAAGITPNHFSTLFHTHTGQTFTEYLTNVRLNRAKALLKDPRLSVSEVAQKVGYDDAGYFARRFRSITGQSPSVWRQSTPL